MVSTTILGDIGVRAAPARGILRRAAARVIASGAVEARRPRDAYLLGVDDASLATFGYDRAAIDDAGRGVFPI